MIVPAFFVSAPSRRRLAPFFQTSSFSLTSRAISRSLFPMQPHRGSTILVLGILSLVICAVCGPIAWAMANKDLAAMGSGLMDPSGMDQTKAGKICGIIGTVFLILGVVLGIVYAVFAVVVIGAAASQGAMQ